VATGGSMLVIEEAYDGDRLEQVRELFLEYADSLGFDLCFQGFQEELATLPGQYIRPGGRLLLASWSGAVAGCAGLRPLESGICEMKRLYVRPAFRGLGLGLMLAQRIIDEGREAGYQSMRLDSLPSMNAALTLYRQLGFQEVPPYRENPIAGAVFLELPLEGQIRAG
jgi:putative acetyltransferase